MHRIPWILRKITSFILIFFLLTDGSAGASAVQVNLHENIPPLPGDHHSAWIRSLPAALGTAEVKLQGMGPMLVHLQTAHGDPEAQTKISEILAYLKANAGIQTVLVEGSSEALDSNRLDFERLYPGRGDVIQGALLRRGWLKGPELFLVRESGVQALGIENRDAYLANGRALLSVLAQSDQSAALIGILQSRVQSLSTLLLRSSTRELLKNYEAWTDHRLPLEAWVPTLQKALETNLRFNFQDPSAQFEAPMLTRFVLLLKLHKGEAPEAYESEKKSLFQALQDQAGDELQACLKALLDRDPDPFGAGVEDAAQTLRRTLELMPPSVTIEKYPHVIRRFQSLMLQDEIDFRALHQEIERLTQLALEAGTDREDERLMLRWIRDWTRYKKIVSLNALPSDLEEVTMNLPVNRPRALMRRLQDLSARYPSAGDPMPDLEGLELLHEKALVFYRRARERDFYMLQNIERILKERRISRAAVVTGGFHAKPFEDYFRDKRRNYIRVIPAISGVSSRDVYIRSALDLGLRYTESQTWETPFISDPTFLPPDLQTVLHRPNNPASGSIKTIGRGRSLMSVRSRVSLGEEAINAPPKGIYGEARNRSELRSQGESETQPPVIFKFFWELTEDERESLLSWFASINKFNSAKRWEVGSEDALVAYIDGRPAGVQAFYMSRLTQTVTAEGLFVSENYRLNGMRLGSRLRGQVLRRAHQEGYSQFETGVALTEEAQDFHEAWIERLEEAVIDVDRNGGSLRWLIVDIGEAVKKMDREDLARAAASWGSVPGSSGGRGMPAVTFRRFFFHELARDSSRESLATVIKSWGFFSWRLWTEADAEAHVIYVDGKPVGAQAYSVEEDSSAAFAAGLYILPEYRGKPLRLAYRLREAWLQDLKNRNIREASIYVSKSIEAQSFHRAWARSLGEAAKIYPHGAENSGVIALIYVDPSRVNLGPTHQTDALDSAKEGRDDGNGSGHDQSVPQNRSELRSQGEFETQPPVIFKFFWELTNAERKSLFDWLSGLGDYWNNRSWDANVNDALIAIVGGKPQGIQAFSEAKSASTVISAGLYVAETYRRSGQYIGSQLRDRVLRELWRRGLRIFQISVAPEPEAQAFHENWIKIMGDSVLAVTREGDKLRWITIDVEKGVKKIEGQDLVQDAETRSALSPNPSGSVMPAVTFRRIFFHELDRDSSSEYLVSVIKSWEFFNSLWANRSAQAYVVYVHGFPAGAQAFTIDQENGTAEARGIFVSQDYRGKHLKLAYKLRETWLKQMQKEGLSEAWIYVNDSPASQRFHKEWARSLGAAVSPYGTTEDNSDLISGLDIDLKKLIWPERAESGSPADQVPGDTGPVDEDALEAPGKQARSELRRLFEAGNDEHSRLAKPSRNPDILRRRIGLFEKVSELRRFYRLRLWLLTESDRTMNLVDQRAFLSLMIGLKVRLFSDAFRVQSAAPILPAGALRPSPSYHRQIEESHLEGGRVLIDGEWILDWGRRNPRGLYVLADSSARLAERMKQPAAALLGDSGVTSKLLEILLNRDSTLGSAERSRVRRLAESGRFEKSFETVPRSEAEAYARRHDGGVAHLHGPESGLALTAADFRLSLDPGLGPSDECAAAWVLPGLLRAASLIRGIKDVSEQRDVLRSRLQDIFPGSSWSPGGILIRIDEAFVRKIVAERLVETAA
ncbi:MAG: hypothetical protein FGM27_04285 [Candidatus Omnitrophica bacterium]|nr:hypothetical protein [Candidatus Omnitrophota bacterium]